MEKSTVLTDPDGVVLDVGPVPQGAPYAEDAVGIHSRDVSTAWVSARELIAAIEKAAGLEPLVVPSLEKKIKDAAGRTDEKPVQPWTKPNPAQLNIMSHAHLVWIAGLRAGRDSMYLCETLEEAEARSPYLVDGQDPVEISLERIIEKEN